ncbi:LacI family transcriptional regulator [bacterium]|nr:MAG: LacI family transcriptional regulator [bacterium]
MPNGGCMATIYDVAQESGCSPATVSNVINNGSRPVRPETRNRILAAVQKLNYHPNAVARGLARQKTYTIGILFGVVESSEIVINAYSAAILQAVLSVAAETGYNVTHLTAPWEGAEKSLGTFRDGRTDGIIVVAPPTDSDLLPALASLGHPIVSVSGSLSVKGVPSIDVDDADGGRVLMDHLIGLGHRRIAHITGHPNLLSAEKRRQAYLDALGGNGIEFRADYLRTGYYSPDSGYANARALLSLPEPPTAIFAGNDEIAFGVLEAAHKLGVSVPDWLSVAAVDDRPLASLIRPSLTTLHQPFDVVGREATRLLIRLIDGDKSTPETLTFHPELVIRDSTAPPISA